MRDYEEVLKQARTCANRKYCDIGGNCEYYDLDVCCQGGEKDILQDAADAIEELLDELTTIRKQLPHWISVEERLPEIGEIVLAYVDELGLIIRAKIVDANDYRGERRIDWARVDKDPFFLSCYTITHWMPLPEPPKEDSYD